MAKSFFLFEAYNCLDLVKVFDKSLTSFSSWERTAQELNQTLLKRNRSIVLKFNVMLF